MVMADDCFSEYVMAVSRDSEVFRVEERRK
jgi:hypothetical protein